MTTYGVFQEVLRYDISFYAKVLRYFSIRWGLLKKHIHHHMAYCIFSLFVCETAWKKKKKNHQNIHSDQISRSVMSDSLRPHESQHTRPPCPSPTPGVHWDLHPLSQWCHPAISSSVVPFSSCPQSLPASESFPMSQLFASDGQSTGVSALASFLPKNTQDWSPL